MGCLRKYGLVLTGVATGALLVSAPGEAASGGTENAGLRDVSVLSASDAWAVGDEATGEFTSTTFVMRWDGHNWSHVDSPSPGDGLNVLGSVEAIAANDVWAVGISQVGSRYDALVEHWDGAAWTVVPTPTPPGDDVGFVELRSISAVGPNDIWAVGGYGDHSGSNPMAEHWDGNHWTLVSTAIATGELVGIWAGGSDDAWAIGGSPDGIEHWDGTSWTVAETSPGELRDIAGASASDVWAVGDADDATTLAEHWNGGSWKVTKPARGTRQKDRLTAVTAISPTDAWAVGSTHQPAGEGRAVDGLHAGAAMLEHWDGSRWTRLLFPNVSSRDEGYGLWSVDASQSDDVWVVGYSSGPLLLHWDGTRWSRYRSR